MKTRFTHLFTGFAWLPQEPCKGGASAGGRLSGCSAAGVDEAEGIDAPFSEREPAGWRGSPPVSGAQVSPGWARRRRPARRSTARPFPISSRGSGSTSPGAPAACARTDAPPSPMPASAGRRDGRWGCSARPVGLWQATGDKSVLVVRRALSDMHSAATAARMAELHSGPFAAVEVPRRGHAPLLEEPQALAGRDPPRRAELRWGQGLR